MRLMHYLQHFRVVLHLVPLGSTWIHHALIALFTALSRCFALGSAWFHLDPQCAECVICSTFVWFRAWFRLVPLGSTMRLMHYLQHFRLVPRWVPLGSAGIHNAFDALFTALSLGPAWSHLDPQCA